jgi:radical SAM superfamily enzyme YgiQ (UPF0313 family)
MRILLIAPASGRWSAVGRGRLWNGRLFRFSLLSLLSVAADTPAGHSIEIIDEQLDPVPLDARPDVVGITCMTALAPRAYALASHFRARGVPVVLGGMHPTLCTEDAARHADAVVVGEAEGVWSRLLADIQRGSLARVYRADHPYDLSQLRRPPRQMLDSRRYASIQAVQATRGCPHRCSFCSVGAACGHTQRRRPVRDVVAEVAGLPSRFFLFTDDNLLADRAYAERLLSALAPLRRRWVTQATLELARDERFLSLLAAAGCRGLFVGLETISSANLAAVDKNCHRASGYRHAIARLHAHGIGVEAGIVFGFDDDRPQVFRKTLAALDQLGVDAAQVSCLTPLPGTALHARLAERIVDHDWAHYDFHHAVFRPAGMSRAALQAGHDWVTHEFYRPWRIARRLWRYARRPDGLAMMRHVAAVNLAYYGRIRRWGIRGSDPAHAEATASSVRTPQVAIGGS